MNTKARSARIRPNGKVNTAATFDRYGWKAMISNPANRRSAPENRTNSPALEESDANAP